MLLNIVNKLEEIKKKLKQLKEQNNDQRNLIEKQKTEIERLQKLIEIQNISLKNQDQKLKIKEIVEAVLNPDLDRDSNKKRALKHKLNEMIKEVDKIINLVQQ